MSSSSSSSLLAISWDGVVFLFNNKPEGIVESICGSIGCCMLLGALSPWVWLEDKSTSGGGGANSINGPLESSSRSSGGGDGRSASEVDL